MNAKIPLTTIEPVYFNVDLNEHLNMLNDFKTRILNQIQKYNHYIEVRQKMSELPDEYLNNSMIGKLYTKEEFRVLLIKGCESMIQILGESITRLEQELDMKMWVNPASIDYDKVKITSRG